MPARESVVRYLGHDKADGQSSRGILGGIRRQLVTFALRRQRADLAALFEHPPSERTRHARAVAHSIRTLPSVPIPAPLITDDVGLWLAPRAVSALRRAGIKTLAALTVRVPRRRRWWTAVPGLGPAGAKRIEQFFAAHSQLTERARALVAIEPPQDIVPWERLAVPHEVDGSRGTFRAPRATCTLRADDDYQAVQTWLALHEAKSTQRAYRKEAERLILWAIVEQGRALSSLTTEDAVAYRTFLRHPAPRSRWVGPPRLRHRNGGRSPAGCRRARSRIRCRC